MRFKPIITFLLCTISPAVYSQGCEGDPDYARAIELRNQKNDLEAVLLLQAVRNRDPSCLSAFLDLGLSLFSLQEYEQAAAILIQVRDSGADIPPAALQTIDEHLRKIQLLQLEVSQQTTMIMPTTNPKQAVHIAVGLGVSDNINNGLSSATFSFDEGVLSGTTWSVKDSMRSHSGSWHDADIAWERLLPDVGKLKSQLQVKATWRDNHNDNQFDVGTFQARLDVKPNVERLNKTLDPSVVVSAGSFLLGGDYYRQDTALGAQIQPKIGKRKVSLGYQFTGSNYQKVDNTDSRFHKLNLNVPLATVGEKMDLGLYIGFQWPEKADKFANYQESSARLRMNIRPKETYQVSASYGIIKQQDKEVYNQELFGDKKRNLQQTIADIGWAWETKKYKNLTYEAKIQMRQHDSVIKLFNNKAIDVTAGVSWKLD